MTYFRFHFARNFHKYSQLWKMPKSKSALPDRWEAYSNIGEVIEGTQFITFKVPLKETIQVPAEMKFTPSILTDSLEERQVHLKLVIDLTNTTRYYNKMELENKGVLYRKIFVPGHVIPDEDIFTRYYNKMELENKGVLYRKIFVPGHVIPDEDIFTRFAQTVDTFLEENTSKENLVGVHCTHGVNRTGYMVCRYMIEKLGIEPSIAISAYGTARGYPIERENYLADLNKRIAGKCSGRLTDEIGSQGARHGGNNHRHRHNNGSDGYQNNSDRSQNSGNMYSGNNSQYRYNGSHRNNGEYTSRQYDRGNKHWRFDDYGNYGYGNGNYEYGNDYYNDYESYDQEHYAGPSNRHHHSRRNQGAYYSQQGNDWNCYPDDSRYGYNGQKRGQRNRQMGRHRQNPYNRQNSGKKDK